MMRWKILKAGLNKKTGKAIIAAPFLLLINLYRYLISPLLPASCRYYPTCSQYTYEAINTHGVLLGLLYGFKRIISCHPWSKGGFDPVPSKNCSHQHTINKAHKNG